MVAAGSGSRLGAALPKALVELSGVPLVRRCVDNLARAGIERMVVMVPQGYQDRFDVALSGAAVPVLCQVGGAKRQDSVRLGLESLGALSDDTVVLVHDAARPLILPEVVERVVGALDAGATAVIPTLSVVDTIREGTSQDSVIRDRSKLHAVQTPQGFRLGILMAAHRHVHARGIDVTDDAAACESVGESVTLVAGHRHALKITEPIDVLLAEAILAAGEDQ